MKWCNINYYNTGILSHLVLTSCLLEVTIHSSRWTYSLHMYFEVLPCYFGRITPVWTSHWESWALVLMCL